MKFLKKSLCLFLIMLFIFCNISTFTFVSSASTSKKTYYYMTADAEPRFSTNKKDENYFYITLRDSQGIYSFSLQAYNEKTKKYDVDLILGNMDSNTLSISNENSNFTYTEKTKTIKINKKYFTTAGKYMNFRLQVTDASTKTKSKKNTLTAYFQVKKLAKKASDGNYFYLNNSPRVITNNLGNNKDTNFDTKAKALKSLSINVVDYTGISNLKLEDMNNTNKTAESKNYSTGTEKQTNITYKLDLSKYTEKDGLYKIKITVTDKSNMKRVCQRFYKVNTNSVKEETKQATTSTKQKSSTSKSNSSKKTTSGKSSTSSSKNVTKTTKGKSSTSSKNSTSSFESKKLLEKRKAKEEAHSQKIANGVKAEKERQAEREERAKKNLQKKEKKNSKTINKAKNRLNVKKNSKFINN